MRGRRIAASIFSACWIVTGMMIFEPAHYWWLGLAYLLCSAGGMGVTLSGIR